jgi:PP-loop superfamily ATP-utilizing enzyme
MTGQAARPGLGAYRRFVVAFSGGKDSLAVLLHLISLGVPAHASTSSTSVRKTSVC